MKLTDFSDTFYVRRLCSDDVENILRYAKQIKPITNTLKLRQHMKIS